MLKRRGARTDPCEKPLVRRRNLLLLLFPLERVKLRLLTISTIMWTMCLSRSNCSSLQVRPRCHTVLQAAVRSTNTAPAFFSVGKLSSMSCFNRWPGLRLTSRVESPPAPEGAMGRWLGRHGSRWVSRGFQRGHTAGIWDDNSLGPKMAFLA